ncbi:MAG: F0F1 ATP synthase subunit delta [Firmicutes bacterium ADurb.Bin080]|mgnify:CR=1 FL=1|jgi:F0F1-type ATP synthase delta subunit|nr:F0F1 ATP synthase subunit delta [Clostridiales bacterium]OQC11847.1 MAG: F0F1 ATP synthase subunit delta [Firmicutes bacterium ADurb.Bin080]
MRKLTITTSKELSLEKKADIEGKLRKKYGEILTIYRVDEAIVGGIIVFDGEIAYDGSIKTQLSKLKEKFVSELESQ